MKRSVSRTGAAAIAAALFVCFGARAHAAAPDSLVLRAPTDVKARSVYNPSSKRFVVWLTWRESPDDLAAFVGPVDTTGWGVNSPPNEMCVPEVGGVYSGDIDRTLQFRASKSGTIGVDALTVGYEVRREEYFGGQVQIPPSYVPNTWIPMIFRDQRDNSVVDLGSMQVRFSAGKMETPGGFTVGVEDFEGFHIWRGIRPDGKDLEVIGELSKEEAFKGNDTGGSLVDSLYFYDIVPTLRTAPPWISPFGSIECLGTRIDQALDDDQFFWFDCNGTNGFKYYYAVTTFDRGYSPGSGTEGLTKHDNCLVQEGLAYPCQDQLAIVKLEVDPQGDLYNVYVVPNPVRTGPSRLTTDNYHNFPDGYVRFVNVPANCTIRIFTVSGDLVWLNEHSDGTGNIEWDTHNLADQSVASGVYVYRIESGSDSVYGRIVVIR